MSHADTQISFVIPVYNGEKLIERMIASIQELRPEDVSYEIVIVDDGSSDRTYSVCENAAKGDESIKLIHTENRGQGAARNTGVAEASGKYIFFADADDKVIAEGVLKLFEKAEETNADICAGTYIRTETGKDPFTALNGLNSGYITRGSSLYDKIKTESAFGYVWNKLFRRGFLYENGIDFDENKKVFMEDQLYNLKAFSCDPEYYFLNIPVYEYIAEGASTTRSEMPDIAQRSVRMLDDYITYLNKNGRLKENADLYVPLALRMTAWAGYKTAVLKNSSKQKVKEAFEAFTENAAYGQMLKDASNREQLSRIPSFAQRVFFGWCFNMLANGRTGALASLFVLGKAFLKAAVDKNVR